MGLLVGLSTYVEALPFFTFITLEPIAICFKVSVVLEGKSNTSPLCFLFVRILRRVNDFAGIRVDFFTKREKSF